MADLYTSDYENKKMSVKYPGQSHHGNFGLQTWPMNSICDIRFDLGHYAPVSEKG